MDEDTVYETERQFPRVPFQKTAWVFMLVLKDVGAVNSPLQLEALNISEKGIKVHSNKKIPIFDRITMRLLDKEGKKAPLTLEAKVVRVEEIDVGMEEKSFGMAMEFLAVPDKTLALLKEGLAPFLK